MSDHEEILARLKTEMPKMPWEYNGVFRTNQGPYSHWELQVEYTRLGDWRGGIWNRFTGITLPAPRLPSSQNYRPIAAMYEALRLMDEWQKCIFSILAVAKMGVDQ